MKTAIKVFVLLAIPALGHCSNIYVPPAKVVTACGSAPAGIQFTDVNSCTWCETVNTSGVMQVALLNCPTIGFILREDGTNVLMEDATKIKVE